MLKNLLTNNGYFKPYDESYRKAVLVNSTLLSMLAVFSVFTLLNITVFALYRLALVDAIGALLTLSIIIFFRKTSHLKTAARITVTIFVLSEIAFFHTIGFQFYSLYWAATTPIISILLLGKGWGITISALFYTYVLFAIPVLADPETTQLGLNALTNIIAASALLCIYIVYQEANREEIFKWLNQQRQQLKILSITDSLTGLSNRYELENQLTSALQTTKQQAAFSILLIDVDHFKTINDKYGHQAGDHVLTKIAKTLKNTARQNDKTGRWGGDEFLVICPRTTLKEATTLAERIKSKIAALSFEPTPGLNVTISYGVAECQHEHDQNDLLAIADKALYQNKGERRRSSVI